MKTSGIHSRQTGAALLLMMLMVLVSVTAILASRVNNTEARIRQGGQTRVALAKARQALLDYAIVQQDLFPGRSTRLPCPDIDATGTTLEGEAHATACGATGVSMLGRLPWRTLGVSALRDSTSECLWYAVSGSWKDAGVNTAALINPDTNGQFQLVSLESGNLLEGTSPEDRPVAIVLAANAPLPGQARSAGSAGDHCDQSFVADDFLDDDTNLGISNALMTGSADTIDVFAVAERYAETHNDHAAIISRADLERGIAGRQDFDTAMRDLGLAVTRCVADYARKNPGGVNDRRMPFPAPLSLADYRPDASYDDADSGTLAGRLPNTVDTSNALTGNAITGMLLACDSAAVPEWDGRMLGKWQNWKDHFFYVVAESHAPGATVPSSCSSCLTVNGAGQYAAVVLFANSRLSSIGQVRDAPPIDADTRSDPGNYLEGSNPTHFPLPAGTADFTSQAAGNTFNDRLFCVDSALSVTEC